LLVIRKSEKRDQTGGGDPSSSSSATSEASVIVIKDKTAAEKLAEEILRKRVSQSCANFKIQHSN